MKLSSNEIITHLINVKDNVFCEPTGVIEYLYKLIAYFRSKTKKLAKVQLGK